MSKQLEYGKWKLDYDSKCNVYERDEIDHTLTRVVSPPDCQDDFRRAALIHKVARKKARSFLYAGGTVASLVDGTEGIIMKLCPSGGGIAFPIGVSVNNVAAHDSKTYQDTRMFRLGDVVKIDIGVHINGHIIDSAFTHIVTSQPGVHDSESPYNAVLEASRDAMFTAIKMARPDQSIYDVSATICEVIKSYELPNGKAINPVRGLGGHNIEPYMIHAGKIILAEPSEEQLGQRMEENEVYAIEPFATSGSGTIMQDSRMDLTGCTHFMAPHNVDTINTITKKDKKYFRQTDLYELIQNRTGLPFSSSWIDRTKVKKLDASLKLGITTNQLIAFPPLYGEKDSIVAQFEHTICINDKSTEIFSLGEDY